MTHFLNRDAVTDVNDFNAKKPSIFPNIDQNTISHFYRFPGFSRLKLYVQSIRFSIKSYVHGLGLLKPVNRNDKDDAVHPAIDNLTSPFAEPFLRQKSISETWNDVVGVINRLFDLLSGKIPLKDSRLSVLAVDQGHISEVTRVGPASQVVELSNAR
jgi:hypothetical protein